MAILITDLTGNKQPVAFAQDADCIAYMSGEMGFVDVDVEYVLETLAEHNRACVGEWEFCAAA